ncbi:tRNA (N(6)-L-threonylcarbamoyladenosine(37)-C(2))-methylthiotransferase MtaB [Prolixibacteraceae bacterium JC049]|nr:tRNA (N(6)-L-threonylcarbamoyladenosine(37)-C(2))-methylthiotransferase MtaB [Prolixibacteraceae bacterium JC049]
MKRVSFKTLGCRLNQYETDSMVSEFHKAGYEIVDFGQPADICVVNTCTVTNQSDHKSRNIISQAASKNPGAMVVVTGCMADNYKQELESRDKVTYVVDNSRKASILPLIAAHNTGEILHPDQLPQNVFDYGAVSKSLHTRSAIKIQDGCDNFCTFCIIPKVRGRAVSRPIDEILNNVKQTLENGFKEIVVTGVNIGRYNYEGLTFIDVVKQILAIPGDFRVRISSLEPDGFSSDFFDLFEHPKLAPHLHLCLQSGSEKTLLQMRRMYNLDQYQEMVRQLRNKYPNFNISTDIIVGFPDESEEDFQHTLDAVASAQFSHVHTFKYSVRKGTRAERMENQIPEPIKTIRSEQVRLLSEENRLNYMRTFIGKEQRVLIEKVREDFVEGYGEHYLPVQIANSQLKKNTFVLVKITGITGEGEKLMMIGEPI